MHNEISKYFSRDPRGKPSSSQKTMVQEGLHVIDLAQRERVQIGKTVVAGARAKADLAFSSGVARKCRCRTSTQGMVSMLSLLIGIVIICVIGAICFWAIDRFINESRLAGLLKLLVVLICLAAILQRVLPLAGINWL